MYKNRVFRFLFVTDTEDNSQISSDEEDEYNKENRLSQIIREGSAIAACDALVKGPSMARVWRITNQYNKKINKGLLSLSK